MFIHGVRVVTASSVFESESILTYKTLQLVVNLAYLSQVSGALNCAAFAGNQIADIIYQSIDDRIVKGGGHW